MQKPLADIVVLDLSRVLSGPFATQQMIDMGALVIKIERPGLGDDTRSFGPPFIGGESSYFLSVNRGKKSVAIDLKHEEGRALLFRIAEGADVAIDNFRPGTAKRLGIDHERLREKNPRLITCTISGYGESGLETFVDRPGYDAVIQAATGLMSITGAVDGPPARVGVAVADLLVGLYGVQGILLALLQRSKTQKGAHVEVSMQDAMCAFLSYQAGIYFTTGRNPARMGDAHPSICPYESVDCQDRRLMIAVGTDRQFERFAGLIGRADLATDPRFSTNPQRVENRSTLLEAIGPILRSKSAAEWDALFSSAGIPASPVLDVEAALTHPQIEARRTVLTHAHPTAGPVQTVGSPVRIDGAAPDTSIPAPPRLGEHTEQVLEMVGLSPAEIAGLVDRGVVSTST